MTRIVRYERSTVTVVTPRLKMLEGIYDVPLTETESRSWEVEVPTLEDEWSTLLITGPSGAGKTSLITEMFGAPTSVDIDTDGAVFDAIAPEMSATDVSEALAAVGFNTIPSWRRPYRTLSNGEQFRASLAATLLEGRRTGIAVADEFTSVVDRQVAKIAAHAAQKYVRKHKFRFVASTCHEDVVEWLQPDAVVRPDQGSCLWRSVQPRPKIEVEIVRCGYDKWKTFAPFHYLTQTLSHSARCYLARVGEQDVAFTAALFRPVKSGDQNLIAASRTVTLPDWQGIGLGMLLVDVVASAYTALGFRFHSYPSHPAYRRQRAKSPNWALARGSGVVPVSRTSTLQGSGYRATPAYRYVGEPMDLDEALLLTEYRVFEKSARRWKAHPALA